MENQMPLGVFVALLPSEVTGEAANEPIPSEFQTSVDRLNKSGLSLCASEYAKYLVEYACPGRFLSPIIERANSSNNVLKLYYGCGFETIILVGENANASDTPTGHIAVGISVNKANATVNEIGDLWLPGTECTWNTVAAMPSTGAIRGANPCIYIRTANHRFMTPPMPEEELRKRHRMIRVLPAADDPTFLEKMEEVPDSQVSTVARAATPTAASRPAVSTESPRKPPAAASRPPPSKKRSASIDTAEVEPKKKRAKKDKTKPKKPSTLYIIYGKANRARVTAANPNASFGDVTKILSQEYKALTPEQKEEYAPLVEADKKRFDDETKAWIAKQASEKAAVEAESSSSSSDDSDAEDDSGAKDGSDDEAESVVVEPPKKPAAKSAKKPKKDPSKPKHGKNAYIWFLEENRERAEAQNPDADYATIKKALGEEYRNLSEHEKAKYVAMAKEDKEKQNQAIEEWEAEHPGVANDDDKSTKVAGQKKKRTKKDPNAPKGPRTAFIFFSHDRRPVIKEEDPDADFGEVGRLLGKAYKAMGSQEKAKYDAMAAEDKKRYDTEMLEYKAKNESKNSSKENAKAAEDPVEDDDEEDGNKKLAAKPSVRSKSTPKKAAAAAHSEEESETDEPTPSKKNAAVANPTSKSKPKKRKRKQSEDTDGGKDATPKKAAAAARPEESETDETPPPKKNAAVASPPSKSKPTKRKESEDTDGGKDEAASAEPEQKSSTKKKRKRKKKRRKSEASQK